MSIKLINIEAAIDVKKQEYDILHFDIIDYIIKFSLFNMHK